MKTPSCNFIRKKSLRPSAVTCAVFALIGLQAHAQIRESQHSSQRADVGVQVAANGVNLAVPPGLTQTAQFDEQILKDRGLDPAIGYYFRRAPRFSPGENIIQVTLNGNLLGRKSATFDGVGQLCFTPAFVAAIGLIPITNADGTLAGPGVPGTCASYTDFSPRTVVTLDPAGGAVEIVTPAEFVTQSYRASETLQGGTGALLNYRIFSLDNRFDGSSSSNNSFRQVDSTIGFNADDWIFRSTQTYSTVNTSTNSTSNSRWQSAYGQKTFADQRQIFQAGRTATQSPLYGGVPIVGAQWFPETALAGQSQYAVTGVASSRARVEVRQAGVLLYSTVVPPGPFSLSDFPLSNRSIDLQVKVIEESGAEKISTVPASSLLLGSTGITPGLSVSAGQLWDATDTDSIRKAGVLTAAQGWTYNSGKLAGVVGGLVSSNYASAGVSVSARPWDTSQVVFAQLLATRDSEHGNSGGLGSAGMALAINKDVQLGLSGNVRGQGYRTVQEAKSFVQRTGIDYGYRTQLGADLHWDAGKLGGFSANVTRQTFFAGDPGYIYSLAWNGSWRGIRLAAGLSHNTARSNFDPFSPNAVAASNNYAFVNLSIPLGGDATSTSYARRSNGVTRIGTGVDQRVNETFGYHANVEKVAGQSDTTYTNLTAYVLPRYTSLTLGAGQGSGTSSFYGEASGGVIATSEGVAFSPYAVRDTFGTLKLSDSTATEGREGVSGIRVETPQGPVWTGPNGLAAIPTVLPYYSTRLEVATATVPTDVDVSDALQVVQAGRGAVISSQMGAVRVRRVLLVVKTSDGNPLPYGAAVLRGADEFFTSSAENGRVLVSNLKDGETYSVRLANGTSCTLRGFEISPKVDGEIYERGVARCE